MAWVKFRLKELDSQMKTIIIMIGALEKVIENAHRQTRNTYREQSNKALQQLQKDNTPPPLTKIVEWLSEKGFTITNKP